MASHSMTGDHVGRSDLFAVRDRISGATVVGLIVGAILVVIAASMVAWDGTVPRWEASILEFFNGGPDAIEPIVWVIQQPGVIGAPVIAGLVVVWFTRRWQHLLPFLAVLPLKLGIEKGLVKQLVERERPFTSIGPEITVRGPAFEGLSFPSGHTTTAFAMALLLSAFLPPRLRPLPVAWAVLVGLARLYFGEHNTLDIVAGAALGTAFAVGLWYVFLNRFVTAADVPDPATGPAP